MDGVNHLRFSSVQQLQHADINARSIGQAGTIEVSGKQYQVSLHGNEYQVNRAHTSFFGKVKELFSHRLADGHPMSSRSQRIEQALNDKRNDDLGGAVPAYATPARGGGNGRQPGRGVPPAYATPPRQSRGDQRLRAMAPADALAFRGEVMQQLVEQIGDRRQKAPQTSDSALTSMVDLGRKIFQQSPSGNIDRRAVKGQIRAHRANVTPLSEGQKDRLVDALRDLEQKLAGNDKVRLSAQKLAGFKLSHLIDTYGKKGIERDNVLIYNKDNPIGLSPEGLPGANARLTLSVQPAAVHRLLPLLARMVEKDPDLTAKVLGAHFQGRQTESIVIYLSPDFDKARNVAERIAGAIGKRDPSIMLDHDTVGMHPLSRGIGYSENSETDNVEYGASGSHANARENILFEAMCDPTKKVSFEQKLRHAFSNHGYNPDHPAFLSDSRTPFT